jgi:hypothetical protein
VKKAREQVEAEMKAANDASKKARKALEQASHLESTRKLAIQQDKMEADQRALEAQREKEDSQRQINAALKEAQVFYTLYMKL